MSYGGLIDIDYGSTWKIKPTPEGRQVAADYAAGMETELAAPAEAFLAAAAAQSTSANPLDWEHVRRILLGVRVYWQQAGFPAAGIMLRPLLHALPDEQTGAAAAALRALLSNGYLEPRTSVEFMTGIPATVALTSRAFEVADSWPSESPARLYERLLSVVDGDAAATTDPGHRQRLERLAESLRSLGPTTAAEVLEKAQQAPPD